MSISLSQFKQGLKFMPVYVTVEEMAEYFDLESDDKIGKDQVRHHIQTLRNTGQLVSAERLEKVVVLYKNKLSSQQEKSDEHAATN